MKINGYGKATEEDIIEYEKQTGCHLPDDYRTFLLENNGGIPEIRENHVEIHGIKSAKLKVCSFRWMTEASGDRNYMHDIHYAVKDYGGFIDPSTHIPFVVMYGYVQLMMINKPGMEGIYVFDFHHRLKESTKTNYLHKVCDTFTDFLDLIVPDEQ